MSRISNQSKIIDLLDEIRNHNLYVHNDTLELAEFYIKEFKKRPVYLVETLATINSIVYRGTMLLYGGHGGGKTELSKHLGKIFLNKSKDEIDQAILRGHQQLTEEKMLGTLNFKQILSPELIPDNGDIEVKWNEFVRSEWKIIDEINRLTPYAQNILLSLLAEGVVKYHNQSYRIGNFTVFATMNPPDKGNEILPPPFLDRFALALPITMPDHSSLQTIGKMDDSENNVFNFSLKDGVLDEIREEVENIKYSSEAEDFINNIITEYRLCDRIIKEASETITVENGLCTIGGQCRYLTTELPCSKIKNPLSVRVKQDLYKYGKALAWFLGYEKVEVFHIKSLAPYMIWHRSNLNKQFSNQNLKENFENNEFSVNANLNGTIEIISLISDRFEKRNTHFLIDYKKALNAILSVTELDKLIQKCKESEQDLMIKKEILPELSKLKEVYSVVVEYKEEIEKAQDIKKLTSLMDKLKREYSIQIRQQLTKQIEIKIAKIKRKLYIRKKIEIKKNIINEKAKTTEIKRLFKNAGYVNLDSLIEFKELTLNTNKDEYDLKVKLIGDDLLFEYRGSETTNVLIELEALKNQ